MFGLFFNLNLIIPHTSRNINLKMLLLFQLNEVRVISIPKDKGRNSQRTQETVHK